MVTTEQRNNPNAASRRLSTTPAIDHADSDA